MVSLSVKLALLTVAENESPSEKPMLVYCGGVVLGASKLLSFLSKVKEAGVLSFGGTFTVSSLCSWKSTTFCVPLNSPSFVTGVGLCALNTAAFLSSNSNLRFSLSICSGVSSERSSLKLVRVSCSSSILLEEGLDASFSDIAMPKGSKSLVNIESALSS